MGSNTIRWQIKCLAKLTEAPTSFVDQVHHLFHKKGICLEDDATPYLTALEAAFRREESIRQTRKKQNTPKARHQRRMKQLQKIRRSLLGNRSTAGTEPGDSTRIAGKSGSANALSRLQRETMPMVPGPEDLQ
jgi:hypothetical protein